MAKTRFLHPKLFRAGGLPKPDLIVVMVCTAEVQRMRQVKRDLPVWLVLVLEVRAVPGGTKALVIRPSDRRGRGRGGEANAGEGGEESFLSRKVSRRDAAQCP